MPKRDLVRDGRLQGKKRTDRSYLRPSTAPAVTPAEPEVATETQVEAEAAGAVEVAAATSSAAARPVVPARATGAARAIQQQGVRKRRDFDVEALARRDTSYAIHELRRIAILAAMVFITLIVLAFVLR